MSKKKLNLTHKTLPPKQHLPIWNNFFMSETKATDDFMQDRADYLHAIAALEREESLTSLALVRAELGLTR